MFKVFSEIKLLIRKQDKFLVMMNTLGTQNIWDLPGGKIQFGESPFESVQRISMDFLQLKSTKIELAGIYWGIKDQDQYVYPTFQCEVEDTEDEFSIQNNYESFIQYLWVSKKDFLKSKNVERYKSLEELIKRFKMKTD